MRKQTNCVQELRELVVPVRSQMALSFASMALTMVTSPKPRAVVVGAGVGGLYTATRLARAGVATTLIEQTERVGGRLETKWLEAAGRRFRFEVGPSLLLLPRVYREALETLGLDAAHHLDLRRVSPSYAVHFCDGGPSPLELGGDAATEERLCAAMEQVEPGAHASYRAYMDAARANLNAGLPIFIGEDLSPPSLRKLPRFLSCALLGGDGGFPAGAARGAPLVDWPLRPHAAQLSERFDAPRHRALLGFQDLYVGLSPATAPAVFSLLQAIELEEEGDDGEELGVFYPVGGFGTYGDALRDACEASGVTLRLGTRATAVRVDEDGSVTGVEVEKVATAADEEAAVEAEAEVLPASCVVVNGDVAAMEEALLPPSLRRSAYAETSEEVAAGREAAATEAVEAAGVAEVAATAAGALRGDDRSWGYSTSSVTFLFCLDKRYDELRHHNVFLAPDAAWDGLFDATSFGGWGKSQAADGTTTTGEAADAGGGGDGSGGDGVPFHFYVAAPARTDPSVVERSGDDAIMVLVPVPPIDERLSDAEQREACKAAVARARRGVVAAFEGAGMARFASHIVGEEVRTPLEWRDAFALRRGAVFGLSHSLTQLSLLRPARRHAGVRGLHWAGASTRPGNGVPLVLLGAELTASEALEDLGLQTESPV